MVMENKNMFLDKFSRVNLTKVSEQSENYLIKIIMLFRLIKNDILAILTKNKINKNINI